MALWVDKHRPRELTKLDYHKVCRHEKSNQFLLDNKIMQIIRLGPSATLEKSQPTGRFSSSDVLWPLRSW